MDKARETPGSKFGEGFFEDGGFPARNEPTMKIIDPNAPGLKAAIRDKYDTYSTRYDLLLGVFGNSGYAGHVAPAAPPIPEIAPPGTMAGRVPRRIAAFPPATGSGCS
jgi:hypothetical protein